MSLGKRIIELDECEYRAVVKIINDRRTNMINNRESTDFINQILTKIINTPEKKKFLLKREYKYER